MAEYANDHPNIFIQGKDLKELVLKTIPVPSKLQEVRQTDEASQLLKEKRQKVENPKKKHVCYGATV